MTENVYVTIYQNQYPDDGFAVGDVYHDEVAAEEAASRQVDIDSGWEHGYVIERPLRLDAPHGGGSDDE